MARAGAGLVAIGSAAGLAIALYNYIMPTNLLEPDSSVTGTAGALLVVASSAVILLAALVLAAGKGGRGLRWFLVAGCLVGVLGTGFAAYLLDTLLLLIAMAVCLLGWLAMFAIRGQSSSA